MKTLVTTILARSSRLHTVGAGCACPTKDGKAPCHCGASCACQGCTCQK